MSWQGWVDQTLVGSRKIDKAAIFSAAGDVEFASSAGFDVRLEEVQYILRGFEDSIPLYSGGLYIAGEKLQVTKADDESIYAQQDGEGVCVVKSSESIIVAHYPETVPPGDAASIARQLAAYLTSIGY
ncbi:unnamed protein product [Penicillium salamii]|uniref:Profilin n=1 Tax=Penicillium salamii TaxID=1612424 RepID=A0A9W4K2C2_9EURO|nr:unnamed protein product [Penicillium salamii]CAG8105971.1 unnamed protein product [Penicillium salamii]CAG8185790.1 unnamed protein product [Penicillium salamii]CAG8247725.1 unnamed protein product [Penicillium salamii]CAG8281657.1 unnamed protein product [Penicillium salamii]